VCWRPWKARPVLEVLEGMCCVLLDLYAGGRGGIRCVLELLEVVLEVLEVLEPGMVRCVPLCMLEAVESVLCLLKVPEVILCAIDRRARMLCAGAAGEHAMCAVGARCWRLCSMCFRCWSLEARRCVELCML